MDRVRSQGVAATGAVLLAIYAITIVADGQGETRLHQRARIRLDVTLERVPRNRGRFAMISPPRDHRVVARRACVPTQALIARAPAGQSRAPADNRSRRILSRSCYDRGDRAAGQGKEAGAIAQRGETSEGLSALVGGQLVSAAVDGRQLEPLGVAFKVVPESGGCWDPDGEGRVALLNPLGCAHSSRSAAATQP